MVLYELLTGKRLFDGETVTHTLADVVRAPIDFAVLPEGPVRELVRRCLDRNLKNRLQHIGEARIAIENAGSAPVAVPVRVSRWPWAVAGVLAIVLGWRVFYPPAVPLRPLIRLNAEIAADTPLTRTGGGNMLAISPDGARLALTLRAADGKVRLHTRQLHQTQVTPLAGTDDASFPFFSPDSQWIGFFAGGKMKKIAVEGGAAVTLCDAPSFRGASWGDDDNIVAALDGGVGLSRVPAAGGTPVAVTKLNPGEASHRWPQILPGSQAVLFTAASQRANFDDAIIDVVSLKTGERKTVARGGFSPHYAAASTGTGHLLYLHQSTLFAVPFDAGRLTVTGSPAPILEDAGSNTNAGGEFALAQNGTFVYLSGKASLAGYPISWVGSVGNSTEPLHAPLGVYTTPRFSPDGKRLAFSMNSGKGSDIWVKDLDRDTPSRLSFLPGFNNYPVWTPDGKSIVFRSTNPNAPGLYGIRSDGSGEAKRLTEGKPLEVPFSFSPDGKRLAYNQSGNGGSPDIFTVGVEGDSGVRLGKAELFLGTPFIEVHPAFSIDGRWLAYTSDESGTFEVYVRPFPGPGGRWQISTGGGRLPLWSRDGRELLFQTLDGRVMAAGFTAKGDSFAAGKVRVWAETRLRIIGLLPTYDLAPDGKRLAAFVSDDASGEKPLTHLTFLLHFFDELRRRAPAGK